MNRLDGEGEEFGKTVGRLDRIAADGSTIDGRFRPNLESVKNRRCRSDYKEADVLFTEILELDSECNEIGFQRHLIRSEFEIDRRFSFREGKMNFGVR